MQTLNQLLSKPLVIVIIMMGGLFTNACIADPSHADPHKNKSKLARELIGGKMVLQIETVSGANTSDTPNKGVFVQDYLDRDQVVFSGVGDERFVAGTANYAISDKSHDNLTEVLVDNNTGQKSKTTYRFNGQNHGEWQRSFRDSDTTISGHFTFTHKEALDSDLLAPAVQGGKTLALTVLHASSDVLPTGTYPGAGAVILQFYATDGTYTAKGFGPGTVDHFGNYEAVVVSPNVVVEKTLQTIPDINYTAPYTLVYTYETTFSGKWYQSFANGLILFSGTFSSFDSE